MKSPATWDQDDQRSARYSIQIELVSNSGRSIERPENEANARVQGQNRQNTPKRTDQGDAYLF
jgi:hypothetical protein